MILIRSPNIQTNKACKQAESNKMKTRKYILKIPRELLAKIDTIKGDKIIVAAKKTYSFENIANGALKKLGISISPDETIICPDKPILPNIKNGRASKHNRIGYEIIHKDQPMESFTVIMTVPNFGDPGKGYHDIPQFRHRYPRTIIPELAAHLIIKLVHTDPNNKLATFSFRVSHEPNRKDKTFKLDLLHCMNLLLENTGAINVGDPDKCETDIIPITEVPWEIFPPGSYEDRERKFFGKQTPTQEEKNSFREIDEFLHSLNPSSMIQGGFSLNKYLGALISEKLIVFDCPKLGNALYILKNDWEFVSKHSRREILSGKLGNDFERIVHTPGWQIRAKIQINKLRKQQ